MSEFDRKILSHVTPTEEDWNDHLTQAHRTAPSMTPAAYASYKTLEGMTSYEVLARSLEGRNASAVLDLACGDGYLIQFLLPRIQNSGTVIGVDMSDGELSVARRRYQDNSRVKLFEAKAQSLPLENHSLDAIVCHMAFMLMLPVGPVIQEIHRVLKSGGLFSALIVNSVSREGFYGDLRSKLSQFLNSRYAKVGEAPTGDPRVLSEAGLQNLFSPAQGFHKIEVKDFPIIIHTDPQGVWDFMKDTYFVSMLPANEKQLLEQELKEFTATRAGADGLIQFDYEMRMFTVLKT